MMVMMVVTMMVTMMAEDDGDDDGDDDDGNDFDGDDGGYHHHQNDGDDILKSLDLGITGMQWKPPTCLHFNGLLRGEISRDTLITSSDPFLALDQCNSCVTTPSFALG